MTASSRHQIIAVVAALAREAKEEIGSITEPDAVEFAHVMHNSSSGGRAAFFFTARTWDGEPDNREPDKCSELAWFPLDALPGDAADRDRGR